MSIADRLKEIHENRDRLKQLRDEFGVNEVDEWMERTVREAPVLTEEERAQRMKTALNFRCWAFRQEMNLGPAQLLVNGDGEVAELLDAMGDFIRIGILETGQIINVSRRMFKPCAKTASPSPCNAV